MKKFTRFMKRFMVANLELVSTLLVIILGAIVAMNGGNTILVFGVVAVAVAVFRYIGNLKTKASLEFLKRIDEANKASKQSEVAHKKAVKQATVSVKKDAVSKEAKAEAKAFLN